MGLFLLICTYFEPDTSRLGVDDWATREVTSQCYDNVLSALLMPRTPSDDPEIRHRVQRITANNIRWLNISFWEQILRHRDYSAWLRLCVLDGDSRLMNRSEIFAELHADGKLATKFFQLAPSQVEYFLRGNTQPGEFERFQDHIKTYRKERK